VTAAAYVVLDGPDGGGKSSQARALVQHLRARGREVVHLREPGSTPVGEALRSLLLAESTGELSPLTEALLFTAARADLVARVVAPALQRGAVVVAERCYVSTLAYQGLAAQPGLDYEFIVRLTRAAHGSWLPDVVFVLDVPVETGLQRRRRRAGDRFEARGPAFHERVRAAYLEVARRETNVTVVDASGPLDEVQRTLQGLCARWVP
jgi:dTMP kinase